MPSKSIRRRKAATADLTKRIFGGNFRNDESDAYRHFMWSGLIRENVAHDRAEAFLNAHEADTGDPEAESQMDKSNNTNGIAAAEKLLKSGNFNQQGQPRTRSNQNAQERLSKCALTERKRYQNGKNKKYFLRSLPVRLPIWFSLVRGNVHVHKASRSTLGKAPFDAKKFKSGNQTIRASMAVNLIESTTFIGKPFKDVKKELVIPMAISKTRGSSLRDINKGKRYLADHFPSR